MWGDKTAHTDGFGDGSEEKRGLCEGAEERVGREPSPSVLSLPSLARSAAGLGGRSVAWQSLDAAPAG